MREHWRQVIPSASTTIILVSPYAFAYIVDLFFILCGMSAPRGTMGVRLLYVVIASVVYAVYRVTSYHPLCSIGYCRWLCRTPWSIDKPLPLGPVHLVWGDLAILMVLILMAHFNTPFAPFMMTGPVIIFLSVYLIIHWLTLGTQRVRIVVVSLFLAPFAIYPFKNPYVAVPILTGLYVLCYIGLQSFLRDFPWNTKYWKADLVQELRKQAIRLRVIGWPFRFLNIYEAPGISVRAAVLLSLLLTWWLHVIRWTVDKPYHLALVGLFACVAALVRTGVYAGTCWPPISFLGRIWTGRLIIPQYDKVFLAPLCVLLAGTLLPSVLVRIGMSSVWSFELSFFAVLFLALSLPPKLRDWRLTGAYRIPANIQSTQTRRPDAREQSLSELFSDKSGART